MSFLLTDLPSSQLETERVWCAAFLLTDTSLQILIILVFVCEGSSLDSVVKPVFNKISLSHFSFSVAPHGVPIV